MATVAITGAFRTTATDILDLHANVLLVGLLMLKICQQAIMRIATLLKTHPPHTSTCICTRCLVKTHRSLLHTLNNIYDIDPSRMESIRPARTSPKKIRSYNIVIPESREESRFNDVTDKADI